MVRWIAIIGLLMSGTWAAAQELPKSLLWQLTGNGLQEPSYLYGTIHLKDKRVFQFNDSVMAKLKEIQAFAMEIALTPENMAEISQAMFLPEGETLEDYFSRKDYKLLTQHFEEQLGMSMVMLERFKPAALIALLTMGNAAVGPQERVTVDEYLYKEAQKHGKQIISLEKVQEQMAAMDEIDAKMIIDLIKNPKAHEDDMEDMIVAYEQQDLEAIATLIKSAEQMPEMNEALLTKRNLVMADRIDSLAHAKPTFFAVGAGHLPGEAGLIALLKAAGFVVEPVAQLP